eukprot:NODE_236_length_11993_cov_1.471078.p9 type:complete len:107 gc:universal NODE_236_length_11993_cov_1.471078:4436-4116(-)
MQLEMLKPIEMPSIKFCKEMAVVPIFKRNSPLDIMNYRPIALASHLRKLFSGLIITNVSSDLLASSSQYAFKKSCSGLDAAYDLNGLIQENPGWEIVKYDVTQAFD